MIDQCFSNDYYTKRLSGRRSIYRGTPLMTLYNNAIAGLNGLDVTKLEICETRINSPAIVNTSFSQFNNSVFGQL